jgi:hypothetical protein
MKRDVLNQSRNIRATFNRCVVGFTLFGCSILSVKPMASSVKANDQYCKQEQINTKALVQNPGTSTSVEIQLIQNELKLAIKNLQRRPEPLPATNENVKVYTLPAPKKNVIASGTENAVGDQLEELENVNSGPEKCPRTKMLH